LDLRNADISDVLEIVATSIESANYYKLNGSLIQVDAVRSGELTTQWSNHVTNDASIDIYIAEYNRLHSRQIRVMAKNIVGDDLIILLRLEDAKPLDELTASNLKSVIVDYADRFHLTISPKRMVIGNNTTEHIKMFINKGMIMQDVMLTWKNSERDTFRKNSFMERVNLMYDLATTMGSRFTDMDLVMNEMFNDYSYIDGLNRGSFTFLPTPKLFMGNGSPEVLLGAFELRNFARRVRIVNEPLFDLMSDLCTTLLYSGGKQTFIDSVKSSLIKDNKREVGEEWALDRDWETTSI